MLGAPGALTGPDKGQVLRHCAQVMKDCRSAAILWGGEAVKEHFWGRGAPGASAEGEGEGDREG